VHDYNELYGFLGLRVSPHRLIKGHGLGITWVLGQIHYGVLH
jgi:hypothetical protein